MKQKEVKLRKKNSNRFCFHNKKNPPDLDTAKDDIFFKIFSIMLRCEVVKFGFDLKI